MNFEAVGAVGALEFLVSCVSFGGEFGRLLVLLVDSLMWSSFMKWLRRLFCHSETNFEPSWCRFWVIFEVFRILGYH